MGGCSILLWDFGVTDKCISVHFGRPIFSHEDATIINQTKVLGEKLIDI